MADKKLTPEETKALIERAGPIPTSGQWCAMGICPKCIHDMHSFIDPICGQFCPECGFDTELPYLSPAERGQ